MFSGPPPFFRLALELGGEAGELSPSLTLRRRLFLLSTATTITNCFLLVLLFCSSCFAFCRSFSLVLWLLVSASYVFFFLLFCSCFGSLVFLNGFSGALLFGARVSRHCRFGSSFASFLFVWWGSVRPGLSLGGVEGLCRENEGSF